MDPLLLVIDGIQAGDDLRSLGLEIAVAEPAVVLAAGIDDVGDEFIGDLVDGSFDDRRTPDASARGSIKTTPEAVSMAPKVALLAKLVGERWPSSPTIAWIPLATVTISRLAACTGNVMAV